MDTVTHYIKSMTLLHGLITEVWL